MPVKRSVPQNFIYNLDLYITKEKNSWSNDYILKNEHNVYFWNSIMPQNNEPLACFLLHKNCKTTDGNNPELNGFLNVVNQPWFQFYDASMLVYACCFIQEKKETRLLAGEILINLVTNQAIDLVVFGQQIAYFIAEKYGILSRFIEGINLIKDISALHNAALFLIIDEILKNLKPLEKIPVNFKKMMEIYLHVTLKTNQKPAAEAKLFLAQYSENKTLKPLIKKLENI
jgi:hypothetical protein